MARRTSVASAKDTVRVVGVRGPLTSRRSGCPGDRTRQIRPLLVHGEGGGRSFELHVHILYIFGVEGLVGVVDEEFVTYLILANRRVATLT